MNGKQYEEKAPTYVHPTTARELLAESKKIEDSGSINSTAEKSLNADKFNEIMQSILDKRLGIDRDKLKEIEAMMEEIVQNENLSPEQKEKALEKLVEMREKIIEESLDIKNQAEQKLTQEV